ncbi:hypothetical protein D3C77_95770 [compost metagenome]
MGGDEVDRSIGPAPAAVEQLAGGGHARGEVGQLPFVAFPEGPHGIAKAVIPFRPAGGEVAHLITSRAAVPGFGDQFDLAEQRVLTTGDEEAVTFVKALVITPENGRQVEAETVHVHLAGPVTQRVGNQLQHAGVAEVEGVTGAGIVDVEAFVVGHQAVIGRVVYAAHGQGRS